MTTPCVISSWTGVEKHTPPAVASIDCADEVCLHLVNLIKWSDVPKGISIICINNYEYIVVATCDYINVLPVMEKGEYKRCSTKEDRRAEKPIQ
jgi:hypothetical protein